jgi:hypothetical protein
MSVAILAHKLNRYIGNCNDQIAQKNNFANNNNMLDAKGIIMMRVKIGCTRNPNHYEQGGGLVWILELINIHKQRNNFQQIDTY